MLAELEEKAFLKCYLSEDLSIRQRKPEKDLWESEFSRGNKMYKGPEGPKVLQSGICELFAARM